MKDIEDSIIATKQEFEARFAEADFYNRQMQDEAHLKSIMDFLSVSPGMNILDLGTGSGYLSFALAKKYSTVSIVGLDIVEKTLKNNQSRADEENIRNICFVNYNGIDFPFENNVFDLVVSRYALHHFPDIKKSLSEVFRVLKNGGLFFISDAAPNENDSGFIDEYMQVNQDGHIKFYTYEEWIQLCEKSGFQFLKSFYSSIRYPRKMADAFRNIMSKYDKKIIDGYDLQIIEDEIYVTEQVNNMLFCKSDKS